MTRETIEIKGIIAQPTVIEGGFIVREARSFGDSSRVARLTEGNVKKFLPGLAPYINWDNRTFKIPLKRTAYRGAEKYGGKPELHNADVLDSGHVGDAATVYVIHGLLADGFAGNAHYEKHSYNNDESLVFDAPEEDLVTEEDFLSEGETEYDRIRMRLIQEGDSWPVQRLIEIYREKTGQQQRVHVGSEWKNVQVFKTQDEAKAGLKLCMEEAVETVGPEEEAFLKKLNDSGGTMTGGEIFSKRVPREILVQLHRNECIEVKEHFPHFYETLYCITEKGRSKIKAR